LIDRFPDTEKNSLIKKQRIMDVPNVTQIYGFLINYSMKRSKTNFNIIFVNSILIFQKIYQLLKNQMTYYKGQDATKSHPVIYIHVIERKGCGDSHILSFLSVWRFEQGWVTQAYGLRAPTLLHYIKNQKWRRPDDDDEK